MVKTLVEHQSKRNQIDFKNLKEIPASKISSLIKGVDPADLRSDFDRWPALAQNSWRSSLASKTSPAKSIVISGLGGSGIIGELMYDLFAEQGSKHPVYVLKDYHLPY